MKKTVAITIAAAMVLTMAAGAFAGEQRNMGQHHGNSGHHHTAVQQHNMGARPGNVIHHQTIVHNYSMRQGPENAKRCHTAGHHYNMGRCIGKAEGYEIHGHYNNRGQRQDNARYYQAGGKRYNSGHRSENRERYQSNAGRSTDWGQTETYSGEQTGQTRKMNRRRSSITGTDENQQSEQRTQVNTESLSDITNSSEARSSGHSNRESRQFNPEHRSNASESTAAGQTTEATVTE